MIPFEDGSFIEIFAKILQNQISSPPQYCALGIERVKHNRSIIPDTDRRWLTLKTRQGILPAVFYGLIPIMSHPEYVRTYRRVQIRRWQNRAMEKKTRQSQKRSTEESGLLYRASYFTRRERYKAVPFEIYRSSHYKANSSFH